MKPYPWKSVSYLLLLVLAGFLAGCELLGGDSEDRVEFTGLPSSLSATPSTPAQLTGSVSYSEGLDSVVFTTMDPQGAITDRSKQIPTGESFSFAGMTISFGSDVCNGTHTVSITAYGEGKSATKAVSVTVTGATNCSAGGTLSLGVLSGETSFSPASPVVLTSAVTCSGCGTVTLAAQVKDADGAAVTDGSVSAAVTGTSTATVTVSATAAACNEQYTVTLTATVGAQMDSESKTLTLAGATSCELTSFTGKLGAQENANGSSIDLDIPAIYTMTQAKTNAATVDLVYAYSFGTDSGAVGSPQWAAGSGFIGADTWSTKNQTKFYRLPSSFDFDGVTTAAEIQAQWDVSKAIFTTLGVVAGDILIAQTDLGQLALIKILSQTIVDPDNDENRQIEIKVLK